MTHQTLNITFTPYEGHRDIKGNKGGSTPRCNFFYYGSNFFFYYGSNLVSSLIIFHFAFFLKKKEHHLFLIKLLNHINRFIKLMVTFK